MWKPMCATFCKHLSTDTVSDNNVGYNAHVQYIGCDEKRHHACDAMYAMRTKLAGYGTNAVCWDKATVSLRAYTPAPLCIDIISRGFGVAYADMHKKSAVCAFLQRKCFQHIVSVVNLQLKVVQNRKNYATPGGLCLWRSFGRCKPTMVKYANGVRCLVCFTLGVPDSVNVATCCDCATQALSEGVIMIILKKNWNSIKTTSSRRVHIW